MVRFSCFQAHILPHKQKKTVQLSSEAMQKTLEDASKIQPSKSYSAAETKSCFKEEGGDTFNGNADHATDSSPTERDCRSEEIESKYSADCNITDHNIALMKKSQSLGSRLNWKDRTSGDIGSEEETEQKNSYDGSSDHYRKIVPDGSLSNQFQETIPSDSVQVNYDFAKNESIFSIGDPRVSEKEFSDKDDIQLPVTGDCGDRTPYSPPVIVKSRSLPSMGSPNRLSVSFLPYSRSDEDLKALDSRKKDIMHEEKRKVQDQGEVSFFNNDKNIGESPANGYEAYNYVVSAKEWIIPASDGVNTEKSMKGTTSFQHWDEVPTKDFRLRRIEEWVMDLQHCSPLEVYNEFSPCDDQELPKSIDLLEGPTAVKLEVKVNPGMEAAKRYISSLNASATAAQLTNLGLVVIPFLSAFVSLKSLNLSGNAIARITAGSLPRGLHILNLSKNYISTIEGLRDLTRLRVLDLSYNRILRIGHGLSGCSSIKELYIAGNKISEVEGLHRLLKINVLDLRFNKISTTKSLGQLAANYSCLQALSLEGNPAQKNVGDEQLKKYVQSLLPNLTYYNRQSIKVGIMKDTADRSTRLGIGAHQVDRGLRLEVKNTRKGTHGIVAQKVSSSSVHGRKSQVVAMQKPSRSRHGRLPPSGIRTATQGAPQIADFSSKVLSLRNDLSNMRRSRSEGTLGAF
ncbi:hypothetical protein ACJIZ3_010816 [Penstemon smallii]|uniref:Uncharacterized protein n=1 Tax=Penstemon smallii TaxID=265156 RepID=A0ABD3UHE1_9LAMI